jgi:hypothetical protein
LVRQSTSSSARPRPLNPKQQTLVAERTLLRQPSLAASNRSPRVPKAVSEINVTKHCSPRGCETPTEWVRLSYWTFGAGWGRAPPQRTLTSSLAQVVILAVIPPVLTRPNQTVLTRMPAQPDLARPYWTVETRRWAVIS